MAELAADQLTMEAKAQPAACYSLVERLTTGEAFEDYFADIDAAIQADPELKEIDRLEQTSTELTAQYHQALREHQPVKELNRELDGLAAAKQSFPMEKRLEYGFFWECRKLAKDSDTRTVQADSTEATELMTMLDQAPRLQEDHSAEAPFKDYKNNTDEVWKYVPDEEIDKFTSQRVFNYTHGLKTYPGEVRIVAKPDQPLEVPTDLIVHLANKDSWQGGDYEMDYESPYGHGQMTAKNLVKHYANLKTDLPEVHQIDVYVQSDGTMFCDNSEGDSHRIIAAVLRGEKTIKANYVTFKRVIDK